MAEPAQPASQTKLPQLSPKELKASSSVRPAQPPKATADHDDRSSEEGDEVALVKTVESDDVQLDELEGATAVEATRGAKSRYHRLVGLGYIVFGALNISLMSACIKYSTFYVTSHEAVFWRSFLSFLFNLVLVRHNKVDLKISPKHRRLLLMRCIFGTMSICFQFYAMSKMVLTDAVMIIFTSPVITFILGAVILRESIDKIDFLAAIFSYTGVIFVTRPAFLFHEAAKASSTLHDSSRSDGIASAMAAAVCQACAYIVMRKLHDVHHMASIHYFAGFGTIFSLVVVFITGSPLAIPPLWSVRLALIAAAFFACIWLAFNHHRLPAREGRHRLRDALLRRCFRDHLGLHIPGRAHPRVHASRRQHYPVWRLDHRVPQSPHEVSVLTWRGAMCAAGEVYFFFKLPTVLPSIACV